MKEKEKEQQEQPKKQKPVTRITMVGKPAPKREWIWIYDKPM